MVKKISLSGIILFMIACNSISNNMTEIERKLINNGSSNTSFRVLLTTNQEDSLFLRKQCLDVDAKSIAQDKDLQLFIDRLKVTLEVEEGVGIAAPQVGVGRNIFLFLRITEPSMPVQVVINPRIVAHSDETVCFERDGCLSIPDVSGNSTRYSWVEVEYYNEKGEQIKEKLSGHSRETGFTGVIFQHEYDHLQGTLFIDKLCDTSSQIVKVEEVETKRDANVKRWVDDLFVYMKKYNKDGLYRFDFCNASITTSSDNKETIILTDIIKSLDQLNHRYQRIEFSRENEESVAQMFMTEVRNHHDTSSDLYRIMLDFGYHMNRKAYIDINDVARSQKIERLWNLLYNSGSGKSAMSFRDNIYAMSFSGVDAKLAITTMSSLPFDMYPIEFLQSIVFETKAGNSITVEMKKEERDGQWYLVLPFAEMEKATILMPELIKLLIQINLQIETLNK